MYVFFFRDSYQHATYYAPLVILVYQSNDIYGFDNHFSIFSPQMLYAPHVLQVRKFMKCMVVFPPRSLISGRHDIAEHI